MATGHLRLVSSRHPSAGDACLDAFRREVDFVFRTLARLGTPRADIEDLAQDVFLALRASWGEYDPARPLRRYLFGIVFRLSAAHHRKSCREVPLELVEIGDRAPRPDDVIQGKQARAAVLAALGTIPLPRRAVLVMHDLDDVPVKEVARTLSIPLFTVYSRLRKGRRDLASAIRRMTNGGARRRNPDTLIP